MRWQRLRLLLPPQLTLRSFHRQEARAGQDEGRGELHDAATGGGSASQGVRRRRWRDVGVLWGEQQDGVWQGQGAGGEEAAARPL